MIALFLASVAGSVTSSVGTALVLGLTASTPAAAVDPTAVPEGSWPLRPRPQVVAGFAPPESAWGSGHRGVDLLGRVGQPVRSALPGRISFAGSVAGRPVVVVDHGPTRTTYEPVLTGRSVGEPVAEGEVVGTLGVVGSHCLPRACLHWGWLDGEVYLDPLDLVGAAPVRLLPLAGRDVQLPRPSYESWRPAAASARGLPAS